MFEQPYEEPNIRSFDRTEAEASHKDITRTYIKAMQISSENELYIFTFTEPLELIYETTTWEPRDEWDSLVRQTRVYMPAMGEMAYGRGQAQASALEDLKEYILVKYQVGTDDSGKYPKFIKEVHRTCNNFVKDVKVFK